MKYMPTALLDKVFPKEEGYWFDYFITTHKGHAQDLAREAVQLGIHSIVVVGGDGTVNEVLQEIIYKEIQLAVIPIGVGNSLANYYKMSPKVEKALWSIKQGRVVKMDSFQVENKDFGTIYGVSSFGYGIGANAVYRFNYFTKRRTMTTYLGILAKEFVKYKAAPVQLYFNNQAITLKTNEFIVGNINQYGGKIESIPGAVPNDGLLDLAILVNFSLPRFFRFWVKSLFRKRDAIYDTIEKYKCSELKLNFDQQTIIHIDLEPYKIKGEVQLEILPDAVHFISPM